MNGRIKLIGVVALGAALLVPVAQAQSPDNGASPRGPGAIAAQQSGETVATNLAVRPDDRAETRGPGAIAAQQSGETVATNLAVRPDDRAGTRGPGAIALAPAVTDTSSHPDNRAEPRGPGSIDSVVVVSGSSGFDWGDALIGSLGGVGAALLLTGCFFLLAGQRNKTRLA
jgi:hypothetical protein